MNIPNRLPEVGNTKVYMCTTDNHKVTWLDNYVTFEFNGVANEDPFDNKFKCVNTHC